MCVLEHALRSANDHWCLVMCIGNILHKHLMPIQFFICCGHCNAPMHIGAARECVAKSDVEDYSSI